MDKIRSQSPSFGMAVNITKGKNAVKTSIELVEKLMPELDNVTQYSDVGIKVGKKNVLLIPDLDVVLKQDNDLKTALKIFYQSLLTDLGIKKFPHLKAIKNKDLNADSLLKSAETVSKATYNNFGRIQKGFNGARFRQIPTDKIPLN